MDKAFKTHEDRAFGGLTDLEAKVKANPNKSAKLLNAYTDEMFSKSRDEWKELEKKLWLKFGMGF